jgi:hypothetical protein
MGVLFSGSMLTNRVFASLIVVKAPKGVFRRRYQAMRRRKVLLMSALALTIANLVALPNILVALAELGGGGLRWQPVL